MYSIAAIVGQTAGIHRYVGPTSGEKELGDGINQLVREQKLTDEMLDLFMLGGQLSIQSSR